MTFNDFKEKVKILVGETPSEDVMTALTSMGETWVDDDDDLRSRLETAERERDEIKQKYYDRFWKGETVTDERVDSTSEGAVVDDKSTSDIARIANDMFLK